MEHVYIISFLALATLASAQYPWPLLCGPKPPTVTPFDPERVSSIVLLKVTSSYLHFHCYPLVSW